MSQTRTVFVKDDGNELWLAPFVTSNWLDDGEKVAIKNAPTHFGTVSYTLTSSIRNGKIQAEIECPSRSRPEIINLRLRHPQREKLMLQSGPSHVRPRLIHPVQHQPSGSFESSIFSCFQLIKSFRILLLYFDNELRESLANWKNHPLGSSTRFSNLPGIRTLSRNHHFVLWENPEAIAATYDLIKDFESFHNGSDGKPAIKVVRGRARKSISPATARDCSAPSLTILLMSFSLHGSLSEKPQHEAHSFHSSPGWSATEGTPEGSIHCLSRNVLQVLLGGGLLAE
ncbi:MAG: hypothetical protein IPI28_18030 [Candidatus Omnitrophica bacterium]|nr:hypothetical protein [Candidatus Omnitrophota bacterium]